MYSISVLAETLSNHSQYCNVYCMV